MHPNNYPPNFDYGERNLKHSGLLGNIGLTPKMSLHRNNNYMSSQDLVGYTMPNQYPKYQSTDIAAQEGRFSQALMKKERSFPGSRSYNALHGLNSINGFQPQPQPQYNQPPNSHRIIQPSSYDHYQNDFNNYGSPTGLTPSSGRQFIQHQHQQYLPVQQQNYPQFQKPMLMPTPTHKKTASYFESSLEKQVERQNQILSQVLYSMNQQNKLDQQQNRSELNKKIKELELNKLQTDLELERQITRKKEKESQSHREMRHHDPPPLKKEKSDLKGALYRMILKQNNGSGSINDTIQSLVLSHHSNSPRDNNQNHNILQTDLGQRIQSEPNDYYRNPSSQNPSMLFIPLENQSYNNLDRRNKGSKSLSKDPLPSITEHTTPRRSQFDTSILMKTENSPNNDNGSRVNLDFSAPRRFAAANNQLLPPQMGKLLNSNYREPLIQRSKTKRKTTRRARTRTDLDEEFVDEEAEYQQRVNQKVDKTKKAKSRVAAFSWALVYSRLLYADRKTTALVKKEQTEKEIIGNIAQAYDHLKEFIKQSAQKEIISMLTDANHKYVFAGLMPGQVKKTEKICAALMTHLKVILNKMVVQLNNASIDVIDALVNLTFRNSFLPNDYFTPFELKRIRFGTFGTIKEMSTARTKLLLGSIVVIRVFIYHAIMRPWELFNQDIKKFKTDRLLNIGSILYILTMDIFKTSVPANQNNQSFLSMDLKIRPKKKPLVAFDTTSESAFVIEKDPLRDGDIIEGFYAKHQLQAFFVDHKKSADELRAILQGWIDAIYEKACPGVGNVKTLLEL